MFPCVVKKLNRKSNLHILYLMLFIRHSFVRDFSFFFPIDPLVWEDWNFSMFSVNNGHRWWLIRKESTFQCRRFRRHWFDTWVWKILWRRKWQPTPVLLPGKSRGQRSLGGATVHEVAKSWTRLTDWECTHTCKQHTRFPHYWNTLIPQ